MQMSVMLLLVVRLNREATMNAVRVTILPGEVTDKTRKLLRLLSHGVAIAMQHDKQAMIFDVAPNFGVPSSDVWAKSTAEVFRANGFNAVAVEIP
jgi:hypothetical protein